MLDRIAAGAPAEIEAQRAALAFDSYVTDNPDGTKTARLQFPIVVKVQRTGDAGHAEEEVAELLLRRPRVADLDFMEAAGKRKGGTELKALCALLARLADGDVTETHLHEQVDAGTDLIRLSLAFADFFPKPAPPPTGGDTPQT